MHGKNSIRFELVGMSTFKVFALSIRFELVGMSIFKVFALRNKFIRSPKARVIHVNGTTNELISQNLTRAFKV